MFNEIEIGETANRIRQYLDQFGESTPRRISKALKLDVVLFYMAIRKLAREDKIVFNSHEGALQISLAGDTRFERSENHRQREIETFSMPGNHVGTR